MKNKLIVFLLCLAVLFGVIPNGARASTQIDRVVLSGPNTLQAGKTCGSFSAFTSETQGISFHSVEWYDQTDKHFLELTDTFINGHQYYVEIWVEAEDGYSFKCKNDYTPDITATVNGHNINVTKAFEYKAFAMVVLTYHFPVVGSSEKPDGSGSSHTHTPSAWRTTQVYHYKVCTTCGDMLEQEDHYGGTVNCVDPAVCSACSYAYIEPNEDHLPDTVWTACGDLYHAHLCKLCGAHCDPEDHRWSPRYHSVDAKTHAYQCADCKWYDKAIPHNPGPAATEDTPQTCKDCGYILAPVINHSHALTLVEEIAPTCTEPGANAYYSCSGCSQRFWDAAGKEPLEDDADISIAPQGHKISNGWGYDEKTHWRICADCNARMEETNMNHVLQQGKCTTCEYKVAEPEQTTPATTQPQPQPSVEENGGLPWWGILLIGLGAVAAGVGTGVLVLQITKKKKGQ